ncbi:hypothetical protein Hanom_Chr12g01065651 [Helianthus anomalus]
MEYGEGSRQTQREIGESSRQTEELPFQEELDHALASCDVVRPINNNFYSYPVNFQLPINL